MAIVMCSWCQYIGQGRTPQEQFDNVEKHEQTCEERIAQEEEND